MQSKQLVVGKITCILAGIGSFSQVFFPSLHFATVRAKQLKNRINLQVNNTGDI